MSPYHPMEPEAARLGRLRALERDKRRALEREAARLAEPPAPPPRMVEPPRPPKTRDRETLIAARLAEAERTKAAAFIRSAAEHFLDRVGREVTGMQKDEREGLIDDDKQDWPGLDASGRAIYFTGGEPMFGYADRTYILRYYLADDLAAILIARRMHPEQAAASPRFQFALERFRHAYRLARRADRRIAAIREVCALHDRGALTPEAAQEIAARLDAAEAFKPLNPRIY